MLFGHRSSLGSTLSALQDPVSNPGRNSCFYCGKKKLRGREEGKQECSLLRQITKSPPMPLILHPPQSDITEHRSLSLFLPSLLLSIATTQRTVWIDRSIHMQSPSMLQMFPFFLFLNSMPLQQMESFWGMKHGEWGWLTGEWKEKKRA